MTTGASAAYFCCSGAALVPLIQKETRSSKLLFPDLCSRVIPFAC